MNDQIINKLQPDAAERIATLDLMLSVLRGTPANNEPAKPTNNSPWILPSPGDQLRIVKNLHQHPWATGTIVKFRYTSSTCVGASSTIISSFWCEKEGEPSGIGYCVLPDEVEPVK